MTSFHLRILPAAFVVIAACGKTGAPEAPPSTFTQGEIPARAVFVVNGGDSTISVLDQASDSVAATIELRGVQYPHHLDLDSAEVRMVLAAPGVDLSAGHGVHGANLGTAKGMVLMLDANSGKLLDYHQLQGSNHNAIFAANDSEVWTTEWNGLQGAAIVLTANELDPIARVEVGTMPAEVSFNLDGSRAFVCNSGSGSVSVIDVANKTLITEIPVGETPVGAWPGRDGLMYVDNEGSMSLSVIDPEALEVTRTYDLGFTPAMATIAPNGELWVTDTDAGRVMIYDPESNVAEPVRVIIVDAGAHAMAFSDDETRAYVSNQRADSVSVIDLAAGSVVQTLPVGHKPNGVVARGGS